MAPRIVKIEDPPVYRPGYSRKERQTESTEIDEIDHMHGLIEKYTNAKQSYSEKATTTKEKLKKLKFFEPNRQHHSLKITMGIRAKKKRNGTLPKVEKVNARRSQQEKTEMFISKGSIKAIRERTNMDFNLPAAHGMPILHLKNMTMMEYNIRLNELMRDRLNKLPLNDKTVKRLVKLRLILEKCQVLEKLQTYKINKLTKMTETVDETLMLKPTMDDFEIKKSNTYKPPKIAKVQFEDKEYRKEKKDKLNTKLANSRIMKDLEMEMDDAPEEMMADGTSLYMFDKQNNKVEKKIKEREQVEEDNFLRLQTTKKDRQMYKDRNKSLLNDEIKGLEQDFKILRQVQNVEVGHKSKKRARDEIVDESGKSQADPTATKFMKQRKRFEKW